MKLIRSGSVLSREFISKSSTLNAAISRSAEILFSHVYDTDMCSALSVRDDSLTQVDISCRRMHAM